MKKISSVFVLTFLVFFSSFPLVFAGDLYCAEMVCTPPSCTAPGSTTSNGDVLVGGVCTPKAGLKTCTTSADCAAGNANNTGTGMLENPIKVGTLTELLQKAIDIVWKLGIPVIVLVIIYTGFLFVAAQGNTTKLTKAKDALLWVIIGSAVVLGSWVLAKALAGTVKNLQSVIDLL